MSDPAPVRITFTDENGEWTFFDHPRQTCGHWSLADGQGHPIDLYRLKNRLWVMARLASHPEGFGAWTVTQRNALRWILVSCQEVPADLWQEAETMSLAARPVPPDLSCAQSWQLPGRSEGVDGYDRIPLLWIERSLHRQTGGIWVVVERCTLTENGKEHWRKLSMLAPSQAALLLLEEGIALPAELAAALKAEQQAADVEPDTPAITEAREVEKSRLLLPPPESPRPQAGTDRTTAIVKAGPNGSITLKLPPEVEGQLKDVDKAILLMIDFATPRGPTEIARILIEPNTGEGYTREWISERCRAMARLRILSSLPNPKTKQNGYVIAREFAL